jgi:hypothetical protein
MFGYLSANVLSEPRGLFAMSRDGFLPRVLSSVHPHFRTPNRAIGIYGVMVATVALVGSLLTEIDWLQVAHGVREPGLRWRCISCAPLRRWCCASAMCGWMGSRS